MLARMTWRQFCEWQTYAALEPFGEERADLRAGIIAATVVNMSAQKRKGYKAKPVDFMPAYTEQRQRQTQSQPQPQPQSSPSPHITPAQFSAMKQRARAYAQAT